jgi:hypothetical protein
VIVSHAEEQVVYRLTQLFRASEISLGGTNAAGGSL